MKSKLWATSVLFCLVVLISACASGENTGNKNTSDPSGDGGSNTPVEIRWTRGENPAQAIKEDTPVIREIQNKTNVRIKLEPVPGSNYSDKKRVLLASNNIPDVIGVEAGDVAEFADTGIFLTISDYLDQMPNFKKVMESHPEISKLFVNGKLYSLPIAEKFKIQGGKAPMIRTDIVQELQLDIPTSFDELYTVLKKMKEAYPDSYPFSSRGLSFMDAFSLGMGSGYGMTYDDQADRYFYGQNKPEFKEVLTYLNKLYQEKLLDPDFAVNTKQNWDEELSTDRAFFYYDNNSFAVNYNATLQQNNPEAKFDRIPYLTNAQGEAKGWLYPKGWLVDNYAISSKTKNPEAIIAMFDWMYGEEGTLVTNYGVEGETFERQDGQAQMLPSIIDKYQTTSDPARVMMSELGTGLLALAVHVDESPIKQLSDPDLVRWGEELVADPGAYYAPGLAPSFTEEEADLLKQYTTKTSPLEEDVVKFIIGTKPLDEFDQWAQQLTAAGADKMEQIYNDAMKRTESQ